LWRNALSAISLVNCGPDTTFKEAIGQLVDHNKHRLWLTDAQGLAVGVLTPTDTLRLVSQ
jgi:predicted transcriptional regulator